MVAGLVNCIPDKGGYRDGHLLCIWFSSDRISGDLGSKERPLCITTELLSVGGEGSASELVMSPSNVSCLAKYDGAMVADILIAASSSLMPRIVGCYKCFLSSSRTWLL